MALPEKLFLTGSFILSALYRLAENGLMLSKLLLKNLLTFLRGGGGGSLVHNKLSFAAFKILSLSLNFDTLILMFHHVSLLGFIFGTFWASGSGILLLFQVREFFSNYFFTCASAPFSLSLFLLGPHNANVGPLAVVP